MASALTPYERHRADSHYETRCSRDGIRTIVECPTCRLAWLMPLNTDTPGSLPVTLHHWYDLWGTRHRNLRTFA